MRDFRNYVMVNFILAQFKNGYYQVHLKKEIRISKKWHNLSVFFFHLREAQDAVPLEIPKDKIEKCEVGGNDGQICRHLALFQEIPTN